MESGGTNEGIKRESASGTQMLEGRDRPLP
jgi:hypothetical protein